MVQPKKRQRRSPTPTPPRNTDWLSVGDAAAELDIAPRNLRTWILRGNLPARKIARDWVIHRPDLEAFRQWWEAQPQVAYGRKRFGK